MADLQSKIRSLPFLTAYNRMQDLYDVKMPKDSFIERGYYAWRDIGNVATKLDKVEYVVPDDLMIKLPDNCEFVKSVTLQYFNGHYSGNGSPSEFYTSAQGKQEESRPRSNDISKDKSLRRIDSIVNGEPVSYTLEDDGYMRISSGEAINSKIVVVYSFIHTDGDGLPMLNDKEVNSIAITVALGERRKELFRKVPGAMQIIQDMEPTAQRLFQAAKIPEKLSDDELNRMLDVRSSWDRKTYGNKFNWGM